MSRKNLLRLGSMASLMFVLTACPYKSTVPISPAEEKVNKKLIGEWIATSQLEFKNPTYVKVDKKDKVYYNIVEYNYSSHDSSYKEKFYQMHTSTVGENTFLNVQSIKETNSFYLYKIEMENDDLTLYEVTENIDEKFNSSAELKSFVEANMQHSFFYSTGEVKYIRKK
ncbi:hypothetical protein K6119_14050 [Paracrocinitomix mangrovi]|uniref:hypothetical protein n=1 Tax=Paracrocinitomix mangrovi TaxID=2862509 RepID=UPI001C8E19F4|nr:hypothetical protein [Paracrocinitomix mangrovi]UKN00853.1 hypothetical protein K6119_14050 [Paracrocinitomix mangrovi]